MSLLPIIIGYYLTKKYFSWLIPSHPYISKIHYSSTCSLNASQFLHATLIFFSANHNFHMSSWYNSEPKITRCVIFIQETLNFANGTQWDSYLLRKAVSKYYIVLSPSGVINDTELIDWESGGRAQLMYPVIRINQRGFPAVKCPTISGTICFQTWPQAVRTCKWVHPIIFILIMIVIKQQQRQ